MTDYAQAATKNINSRVKLPVLFSSVTAILGNTRERVVSGSKTILNRKKVSSLLLVLIVGAVLIVGVRFALSRSVSKSVLSTVSAPDAITVPVEREFSFKVYDQNKQLSDPVRYIITSAQLTKQIIIKGQKANAVSGRMFLILNLKLVNDFDKSLFLNTRNYIRIQPLGTQDNLAPEIHNDTVEAQPLSTKLTRIGLPVDERIKEFTLFVGELEGGKEAINIRFP